MHYLLQQFKSVYEGKLKDIEEKENTVVSKEEILQEKLELSKDYINDLAEQNIVLVQTAEELRESAENRVNILEKLLQKTSVSCKDYMQKLKDHHEEYKKTVFDKLLLDSKVQDLEAKQEEMDEEIASLKIRNSTLLHNISLLIHFINNSRNEESWNITTFGEELCDSNLDIFLESLEPQYVRANAVHDRFGQLKDSCMLHDDSLARCNLLPPQSRQSPSIAFSCTSQDEFSLVPSLVTEKDVIIKRLQIDLNTLLRTRNDFQIQLLEKDRIIANLQSQITELKHELDVKEIEVTGFWRKQKQNTFFQAIHEDNHLDLSRENCSVNTVNSSSQTEMSFGKICLLQKEMNELQSAVVGLKYCSKRQCSVCGRDIKCNEHDDLTSDSTSCSFKCQHNLNYISAKEETSENKHVSPAIIMNYQHPSKSFEITTDPSNEGLGDLAFVDGNQSDEIERILTEKNLLEECIKQLNQDICCLREELKLREESAKETRQILTQEVAERHDVIKVLRHEMTELMEQHKESVQQLVLKAEIIKDLRKEVKHLENKMTHKNAEFETIVVQNNELQQQLELCSIEMENQKVTIANLQDAIVRRKQIGTALPVGSSVANGNTTLSKSHSEVFDI